MEFSDWITAQVQAHEAALCRYAFSLCGNEALAKDAVQETFLRLCRAERGKVEGHEAAWLFKVCRSRVIDLQRKAKPMQTLTPRHEAVLPDPARTPYESALHRDAADPLPAMMARLTDRQREALRLKFQEDMSYRDIAGVMNLTEGNVGFILHTALKTLGKQMKQLEGVPA